LTGFVLAPEIPENPDFLIQDVSPETQAFVWGSKWHDRSGELPGIVSSKDQMIAGALIAKKGILNKKVNP